MWRAIRAHWPEYLMEAGCLGVFMLSAGLFGTMLEYPNSPVHQAIANPFFRRAMMGLAMGLTAVAIIYSPWGQQSGAHMNPAVTLTFWRLGKIARWDAVLYVVFQFVGGLVGVVLAATMLGNAFLEPPVSAVATVGVHGTAIAFLAEIFVSFLTMTVVLAVSNSRSWARWTGSIVGGLVVGYIIFEAPFSGFSQNPARTVASALAAGVWTDLWVYLTAPPLGMLLAAEAFLAARGLSAVACAKLHHENQRRCIFCEFQRAHVQPAKPVLQNLDLISK